MSKANSIIIDVGGGSTEIMLLQKGKMVAAHSFRMGTVIIEQQIKAMMGSSKDMRRFLAEYIRTTAENLNNELRHDCVKQLVAIGNDARLAARSVGTQVTDLYATITREAFIAFVTRITGYTVEECVQHFRISYGEAEDVKARPSRVPVLPRDDERRHGRRPVPLDPKRASLFRSSPGPTTSCARNSTTRSSPRR